jgi:hypothetical protein
MLDFIIIWFVSSLLGCCYQILVRPGELLQGWARLINTSNLPGMVKKLIMCPYCLSGQIALWWSLFTFNTESMVSIPMTIITVYHYIKTYHAS